MKCCKAVAKIQKTLKAYESTDEQRGFWKLYVWFFKQWQFWKMAGVEGIEPSHTAPETAVLPLDDTPTLAFIIY